MQSAMFQITGFFAALLAVEYFVLSLGVVVVRRTARIPVGEGVPVNTLLRKRIRVRTGRNFLVSWQLKLRFFNCASKLSDVH